MIIIADFISETMQVRRPRSGIFKVLKKKKKQTNKPGNPEYLPRKI